MLRNTQLNSTNTSKLEELMQISGLRTEVLKYLDQRDVLKLSITSKKIQSILNSGLNYKKLNEDINELERVLEKIKRVVNKYKFYDKGHTLFEKCNNTINATAPIVCLATTSLIILSPLIKLFFRLNTSERLNIGGEFEMVLICLLMAVFIPNFGAIVFKQCKERSGKIDDDDWQTLLSIQNKYSSFSTNTISSINRLRQNSNAYGDEIYKIEKLLEILKKMAIRSPLSEISATYIDIREEKDYHQDDGRKNDASDSEASESYIPLLPPQHRR